VNDGQTNEHCFLLPLSSPLAAANDLRHGRGFAMRSANGQTHRKSGGGGGGWGGSSTAARPVTLSQRENAPRFMLSRAVKPFNLVRTPPPSNSSRNQAAAAAAGQAVC